MLLMQIWAVAFCLLGYATLKIFLLYIGDPMLPWTLLFVLQPPKNQIALGI